MATQALALKAFGADGVTVGAGGSQATMTTGTGNGKAISFGGLLFLVLLNDTAGAATYTIKTQQPPKFSGRGITVPDETHLVAAGDTKLVPTSSAFDVDGSVIVECDVAAKIDAIRSPVVD